MAKATGKKAAAPKKAAAKKAEAPQKAAAKKAAAPPAPAKKAAAKKAPSKAAAPKKAAAKKATHSPEVQKNLLQVLLVDGLKDIYWAEKHLTKAAPKLMKATTSDELKQAFETHRIQTEQQIVRLEQVFQKLGLKPVAIKCEAMAGLTKEAENIVAETQKGTMSRDAGIILAQQKIEHYEIATYGGLAQLAATLGLTDVKNLLGQTLQEEKDTDILLSEIAERSINFQASEEEGKVEDDSDEESDPT